MGDLAVEIGCCSKLHRGMLQHMDFRSAGEKRHDEYKLETACSDRLGLGEQRGTEGGRGVLARPFVGREKEHPFCENSSQYCSSGN